MALLEGLVTGVISGRISPATEARAKQCKMTYVYQGHIEKIPIVEEILTRSGIAASQVAYIGDDLTDVVVMNRVGLSIAPANARPEVKRSVQYVTEQRAAKARCAKFASCCSRRKATGTTCCGSTRSKRPRRLEYKLDTRMSEPIGIVVVARSGPGRAARTDRRDRASITGTLLRCPLSRNSRNRGSISRSICRKRRRCLQADLVKLAIVRHVNVVKTLQKVYGKRIIIVGGGAQVGQVAIGAISEADRHNIRGEHISVDTIPLVGEQPWRMPFARWDDYRAPGLWCWPEL